jgi:hypothetical protein
MSGIGDSVNAQIYGGSDGNPIKVSAGGGMYTQFAMDDFKNLHRYTIRSDRVTRLPDLPTSMVLIYNEEGNDPMWIGGYGDDEPAVHDGIPLFEGNYAYFEVTNANKISIIAETNAQVIFVAAFLSGTNTLDPDQELPEYPPDTTAPTITTGSVSPANGSTNIDWNVIISIPFSEDLDESTVTTDNFTLEDDDDGDTLIPCDVYLDSSDSSIVLMQPTSLLTSLTDYTARVTTDVADEAGNTLVSPYEFSFQTALNAPGADNTPPTYVSSSPVDGATNVSLSATITLTFSEAIQQPNASTNPCIKLYRTSNGSEVTISIFSMSGDAKTVTLSGIDLEYSTAYYIDILGADRPSETPVKDIANNELTTTSTVSFTTTAPPLETVYSVGGNTYYKLDEDNYILLVEKVVNSSSSMYNRTPKEWEFDAYKVGSPDGSYTIGWYRLSGSSYYLYRTLKTDTAASLSSTAGTKISINDSTNEEPMAVGDYVGFAYTGGSSSNYIAVKLSSINAVDSSNSVLRRKYYTYGPAFGFTTESDVTSQDLAFTMEAPPL